MEFAIAMGVWVLGWAAVVALAIRIDRGWRR